MVSRCMSMATLSEEPETTMEQQLENSLTEDAPAPMSEEAAEMQNLEVALAVFNYVMATVR